jgi:hypothetical protein
MGVAQRRALLNSGRRCRWQRLEAGTLIQTGGEDDGEMSGWRAESSN